MKSWKAIPRSKRDRLTKKQIAMMDKPDLMTDALAITTAREKKKGTIVVEDKQAKATDNVFDLKQSRPLPCSKPFKED